MVARSEQELHFLPERLIGAAGSIQKDRALMRLFLQQTANLLPAFGSECHA
jgi:hypothetical protein